MEREKEFFIRLLSDHLNGVESKPCSDLQWFIISNLAHIHQVQGIVYYQCKDFMPDESRLSYETLFLSTLYNYSNRKSMMNMVGKEFKESGLRYFVIKGFEIAQYYPLPGLRTMGDCDIVVSRDDIPKAVKIFREFGFNGSDVTSLQQWACNKNGFKFEIHDRLVQVGEYATNKQASFFNNYYPYIINDELDSSFHFLYLLMHLRKHFLNHGVGIRQFMDLAVMGQNNTELRWDWIEKKLIDLKLLKYAQVCAALIEKWFNINIPLPHKQLEDDVFEQITEKILNNGVFGFDDRTNQTADAYTALIKARGPIWLRRINVILKSTFLNYEIMRGYADCEFVDGRPWLMPIAWIKRLIIISRRQNKAGTIEVIKNSLISEVKLKERRELLEKMELL